MNSSKKFLLLLFCSLLFVPTTTKAQYYEIANQIPRLISPALSGKLNYKGYAEVSYMKGMGNDRIDYLDISTTQGFKFASWFYMGIGAGIDVMFPNYEKYNTDKEYNTPDAGIMVPLYSDFRFFIGKQDKISLNIDLRLGAAFNFTEDFRTTHGYLAGEECFYLKPSLGIRIPINKNRPKQAINVGVGYQLLVSDWWTFSGHYDNNKAFSNLGATIGFEW